jgi:anthraniloyl-CoA monooxygenase
MKIAVIGAGPAGLYFSILIKKAAPYADVTVYERNHIGDTFGFGVVFSDQTLDTFERHDPESYLGITRQFVYWDDIEIHFKGSAYRIGGNGFCGCSRRMLLLVLHERASDLGVEFVLGREVADIEELARSADLVVLADGVNSRSRELHRDHFQPTVDLRPNKFAWMGAATALDAFTFAFEETEFGVFIAHAYQYQYRANRSTWVFETDAETFARAGLDKMSEEESAKLMERIFARYLDGQPVLTNRSLWRNFPMIRNRRWVKDNIVLLGDAKATAHFSIGAGTKLAMEDAVALYEAFVGQGGVEDALAVFETSRRDEVERTQHAADVSLVFFEHLQRFWNFDPAQFAFGVMTRAKAITYDNLRLRAPDFVDTVDRFFAGTVGRFGFEPDLDHPLPPMFQPFRLREMPLRNRVVVSPMCMYSAEDGVPGDWHLVHYGARALGGAGLLFTEMTNVSAEGRISPGCTGLWNDTQEAAWKRIVDFVHAQSEAKICLQVGHAGRKASTRLMWEGDVRPLADGNWPVVAASAIPYFPESQVPRELTRDEMERIVEEFVETTVRAERIGFDMIELHAAHGYLLAGFISPLTNRRTDRYGGPLDNRLRFPLEVFRRMRDAWPGEKPMSVRLSATDWAKGGITGDDAVHIAEAFAEAGVDLVDVSTGQTVRDGRPLFGRMFQTPFSDQIRNEAHVATMCVGNITTPDQVNTILAAGRADLVALARPHLTDPNFTIRAAAWYGVDTVPFPPQYNLGRDQLYRNSKTSREELEELRLRVKPRDHRQPKPVEGAQAGTIATHSALE